MTKDLAKLNIPLSNQATIALRQRFIDKPFMRRCCRTCQIVVADRNPKLKWHKIDLNPISFEIISQLFSRVFLGQELCRNEDSLQVTVGPTFAGPSPMANVSPQIRPLVPAQLQGD